MYVKDSPEARKVRRVAATMAVEGMPLEEEFVKKLLSVARGEMTSDELRREIMEKYGGENGSKGRQGGGTSTDKEH